MKVLLILASLGLTTSFAKPSWWFLTNDKTKKGRNRSEETLFIDARDLGFMEKKNLRVFLNKDISKIADTVSSWRNGKDYKDIAGYCKSSNLNEIKKNNFILTPGRYVGYEGEEKDKSSFKEKFSKIKFKLEDLLEKNKNIETKLKNDLGKIISNDN